MISNKKILTVILFCFTSMTVAASDFNAAIPIVLRNEGKLENDPSDNGGITKYGISLRYIKELIATRPDLMCDYDLNNSKIINDYDIANMSLLEAEKTYKEQFWDKYKIGRIKSQAVATKVFDMSVNMGERRAFKILQEACGKVCGGRPVFYYKVYGTHNLAINGILNDETVEFINGLNEYDQETLMELLKKISFDYYEYIANKHPTYKKFLSGWIRRARE